MKARSTEAVRSMAEDINVRRNKYWPPDDAGNLQRQRCNPTYWCEPCRKSWKKSCWIDILSLEVACPHCLGKLSMSYRRPVPWSKKGRKWRRRAKYKRG